MRGAYPKIWPALIGLAMLAAFVPAPVRPQTIAASGSNMSTSPADSLQPKKNPGGAALRSLVIPGWGQWYNDQKIKAVLVFGAETGMIGTAIYWNQRAASAKTKDYRIFYQDNRNLALWFLAGTVVLSMLDAYVDAHLYQFDEGPSLEAGSAEGALRLAVRFKIHL